MSQSNSSTLGGVHVFQPQGRLRLFTSAAALALLAVLFLLPGRVFAVTPPTITGDATASVAENTPTSTMIKAYTTSDGGDGDTLTLSLEGVDMGDFEISTDGKLTFKEVPDFENPADNGTNNVYNVTVKSPMMRRLP